MEPKRCTGFVEELINFEIGGGAFLRSDQDFDVGQRRNVFAEEVTNDPFVHVFVESFGEEFGVVFFKCAGFLFLERGTVTTREAFNGSFDQLACDLR